MSFSKNHKKSQPRLDWPPRFWGRWACAWLNDRPDLYLLACWLIFGTCAGYQRLATSWCDARAGAGAPTVLPEDSPLMLSFPCNGSVIERCIHMLRHPVQVYRDLLWDSPHPIRWVQGQILAVIVRFLAVVLLPPALYRAANPWLVVASRAVAPACLVAVAWGPALEALVAGRGGSPPDAGGALRNSSSSGSSLTAGDEYIEFSLRWYPLMDVAFTYIHPTSMVVEAVYGVFSLSCILTMGLPALPGKRLPRGFFLPQQLVKCVLSTLALLAIERWRLLHKDSSSSSGSSSGGGGGGGASRAGSCGGSGGSLETLLSSGSGCEVEGRGPAAASSGRGGTGGAGRQVASGHAAGDPPLAGHLARHCIGTAGQGSAREVLPDAPNRPLGSNPNQEPQKQCQQQQQDPPRPHLADPHCAHPTLPSPLRLILAETRRLRNGRTTRNRDGGGSGGRWAPLIRQSQWQLSALRQLRAMHQLAVELGLGLSLPGMPGLPQTHGSPSPKALLPQPLPAGAAVEGQQQGALLLRTCPMPPYGPFHEWSQAAAGEDPQVGPGGGGGSRLLLPTPPLPPLRSQQLAAAEPDSTALTITTAAAGAEPEARGRLHRGPDHVPYMCRTSVYTTRIKIDGCETEQVAPGYTQRISRLLAQDGMQVEAVVLRRGCIELFVETRAVDTAPLGLAYGAAVAAPPGTQVSESAPFSHVATAAVESASDCRSTRGPVSSLSEGRSEGSSSTCAGAPPTNPFDDVLDIGALIRALQLPETSSLELDLAPANDDGLVGDGIGSGGGGPMAAVAPVMLPVAQSLGGLGWGAAGANADEASGEAAVSDAAGGDTWGATAAADPWVEIPDGVDAHAGRSSQGWQRVAQRAAATAAPRVNSPGLSGQVFVPSVLDVYPRVLLAPAKEFGSGPESEIKSESGSAPKPTQREASPALQAPPAVSSTSLPLVVVLSWVASCGMPNATGPSAALAAAVATATVDPRGPCAAGHELPSPGQVGAPAAAAAGGSPQLLPGAQIRLRSDGEVVAVAAVAPSAAANAAAAASMVTGDSVAGGALEAPPLPPTPSGSDSCGDVACDGGSSGDGGGGSTVDKRPGPSAEAAEAAAVAREGLDGPEAGGVAMCSEAVYSIDVGPLLRQLRSGVVLVDAQLDAAAAPAAATGTAGHGPWAVPVLVVDDPRVAAELQQSLDTWYGTVDELDNLLYDIGALMRLQDELVACAGALGGRSGCGGSDSGGSGGAETLQLSALSARAHILYNHLVSYIEAMSWEAARSWLGARQQAAAAAVAAAKAAAAAAARLGGTAAPPATGRPAVAGYSVAAAKQAMNPSSAAVGTPATGAAAAADGLNAAKVGTAATAAAAAGSSSASKSQVTRHCGGPVSGVGRRRRLASSLQGLWSLLVLGWRSEGEADAAAYAAYTARFAANTMNVMQVMDLLGFVTVMTRSSSSGSGGGAAPPPSAFAAFSSGDGGLEHGAAWPLAMAWLDPDKACVLVAASTGVVLGALWLVLPRPAWRRLSAHAKWPRQVSYTLSKAMVAFLGFPQPPSTLRHELGGSVFVVEGVILPAAVLMSPMESVVMGLIRAPLCARMWLRAAGSQHTVLSASLRALGLSALNVLTTIVVHLYIRMSYERRRGLAQHAKAD